MKVTKEKSYLILAFVFILTTTFVAGICLGLMRDGNRQSDETAFTPMATLEPSGISHEFPIASEPASIPHAAIAPFSEPRMVPEGKTSLAPGEAAQLNLKLTDLPSHYIYNAEDSGLIYDAATFAKGDAGLMRRLAETGWMATDMTSYAALDPNKALIGVLLANLQIYENAGVLDCRMNDAIEVFTQMGGKPIKTSRKFGDNSHLYLVPVKDQIFPFHQLSFYYGNVYAELVLGAVESVPVEQKIQALERYASIVEQRLTEACPQCVQTLPCSQ